MKPELEELGATDYVVIELPAKATFLTKNRGFRRSVVLVVAAAIALFGCSSDGESPLTTADLTLPSTTAPAAPVEPAPEEPAPEEPAEQEPAPEDDGLTTEQWVLIILGGLLIVALVMVIAALLTRRNDVDQR